MLISNQTYGRFLQAVAITTVAGTGSIFFLRYRLRKNFQNAQYYTKTLKLVEDNPVVEHLLGKPIRPGRLDLADPESFYATEKKARLLIPVFGAKESGIVYSWCVREAVDESTDDQASKKFQWKVMRVELMLKKLQDKRLVVYKLPEADESYIETFDDFYKKKDCNDSQ